MKQWSRRGALIAGLAAAAAPQAAAAQVGQGLVRRLRAKCEDLARRDDLSGAVVLMQGERAVFRAAYGQRNRGEALPNRPDTKFNIASIGKLFTSLAVMRLAEAGRLDLDAPLRAAWPDYPNQEVAARISAAQLLTHTAGMGNHFMFKPRAQFDSASTQTDYTRLFVDEQLEGEPGGAPSYSNDGFILLGALVERLTGRDFRAVCRETIFAPLGMRDTSYMTPDDVASNVALPYVRDLARPGVWRSAIAGESVPPSAAGGPYSTVDDLARFGAAMSDGRLLNEASMRAWTRAHTTSRRGGYGYGVEINDINGHRVIGHSGGHYGVAGELMVFEGQDYVFTTLTNGEVDPFWDLAEFIKTEIAGESESARNYAFTRNVIDVVRRDGVEAGLALCAASPDRRPREGVIDTLAMRAWHRGESSDAEALLAFNLREFPDSLSAIWSSAEFYRRAGRRAEAIAGYRAFLALQPEDGDALAHIAALSAGG